MLAGCRVQALTVLTASTPSSFLLRAHSRRFLPMLYVKVETDRQHTPAAYETHQKNPFLASGVCFAGHDHKKEINILL